MDSERTFTEDLHAVLEHPRAREIVDFIIAGARREERDRCRKIFLREMDKIAGCWLEDYIDTILREIEKEPT